MAQETVRIVHAADIHLDSPLRGLARLGDEDLVQQLRQATRQAFDRLVEHCCETRPDALVIAGDLYDGDWRDYTTGAHFVRGMQKLDDVGVEVVVVQGNHDAESVITRTLSLPPNVHRLRTDRPETVRIGDGLAVHGQGFASKSVRANLAVDYPERIQGVVNVGILHTSVQGYEGHESYAPCTLNDLTARGYEYFALGHVHKRQVLAEGLTTVAFSGNLQGRHPRETGPKGAWEVTLAPEEQASLSFVELDVARWEQLDVDLTGVEDYDEALARVEHEIAAAREGSGSLPVVTRITLTGASPVAADLADRGRLDTEIAELAARHRVAVDRTSVRVTVPAERRVVPDSQRRMVLDAIEAAKTDPEAFVRADKALKNDLDALISEVDLLARKAGVNLRDRAELVRLVDEAADELLARIDGGNW